MARRSAGRRLGRITTTLLGVALATAFCVAAFGVAAQLEKLVAGGQDAVDSLGIPAGSVVVTSRANGATEATAISNELVDRIAGIDGVLTAQGTFDQPIGVRLGGGVQQDRPPILRGLLFTSSWDPTRWTLTEGSPPDFWSPDRRGVIAVALDAGGLLAANTEIGGEIQLQTPTGGWRGLVVGVVSEMPTGAEQAGSSANGNGGDAVAAATTLAFANAHIVMPSDILPTVLGAQGRVDRITVTPRPGITPESLATLLEETLPSGLRIIAATDRDALRASSVATISGGISAAAWAFALLAAVVAAIIVSNTFSIIVSQRTAEIALARCIGFTRGQSFAVFVGEASIVGVFAACLGLTLGVPLAVLGASTLRPSAQIHPMVTPAMVAAALGVGLGVTVISALRPALKASRVSPLEALRTSTTRRHRRGVVLTLISPLLRLIRAAGSSSTTARMALDNARRDPGPRRRRWRRSSSGSG
ncbi:MAG: FtsX-like permease family protein [Microthrixaceae bacterium]